MAQLEDTSSNNPHSFFLTVSVLSLWLLVFFVWRSVLWHDNLFTRLNTELPVFTDIVFQITQLGLPFVITAAFTAIIIFYSRRHRSQLFFITSSLLSISILLTCFAITAITSPMVTCKQIIPGWPQSVIHESSTDSFPVQEIIITLCQQ